MDEKRPVVEVSAEAQTMTPDQLQKTVAQYQRVLESKKNEFVAMQNKIKEIPLTQMMGEEAKKIKDELTTIASSVSALTERMNVYVAELSKK